MEVKLAQFTNTGMNKDLSISKSSEKFAYHNENIRITSVGKESLLSVTNERTATTIPITNITREVPNNWFRYVDITKDDNGDYSLIFKSDYKFKTNVSFDVTLKYYKQEGLDLIYSNPDRHEIYIISRKYSYFNIIEHKLYFIWQLNHESSPDKIYFINENKDYISLDDTIYIQCDEYDPDKVIKIGSTWYKINDNIETDRHFLVECFKLHGYDDVTDKFDFEEPQQREHTFTLTAQAGKDYFKYKIKELPGLTNLLPGSPSTVDDWVLSGNYNFMSKSDIEVVNTSMDYTDDYFFYTSNNSIYPQPTVLDSIRGEYVGHCVANDYIVLFTKYKGSDYIYRINKDSNGYTAKLLFIGHLSLSTDNPLETLFYYESEDIQKVYWLDGINQPRVINIIKEDYIADENGQFDFAPSLRTIPTVSIIKKFESLGNFHSGVVQYFITYYKKFGSESKIVYSSSLNYITPENRAGAADEFCSCSFDINISNIDTKFDYLRLYSIKRQSIDGPVEANIVADIKIQDREKITITDTGANQAAVDINMLYFIGGTNFIAQTFAQKDDVLFLGNIELTEPEVNGELKKYIKDNWIADNDIKESQRITFDYKCFTDAEAKGLYPFKQQINYSSITFKSFKFGEIYRFGIQYQDKSGSWTQPVWIGDKKCTIHPYRQKTKNNTAVATAKFSLTDNELLEDSSYMTHTKDYIKYRIVMAKTDYNTRSVVAQGIVCPTIFNYNQRVNNEPYAVSSPIMRPRNSNVESTHFYPLQEVFGTKKMMLNDLSVIKEDITGGSNFRYQASCSISVNVPSFFIPYWEYVVSIGISLLYTDSNNEERSIFVKGGHGISSYSWWNAYTDCIINGLSPLGSAYSADSAVSPGTNKVITRNDVDYWINHHASQSAEWVKISDDGLSQRYQKTQNITDISTDGLYLYYQKYVSSSVEDTIDIVKDYTKEYYVDESIVTFNSPDIERNFNQINNSNLNFRLVGIAPITSSKSDYEVQFDENTVQAGSIGKQDLPSSYNLENIANQSYTLTSDYLLKMPIFTDSSMSAQAGNDLYKIFMWHFDGSLIGKDNVAIMTNKTFSTKRFSICTEYFPNSVKMDVSDIAISNGTKNTINKINISSQTGVYTGGYEHVFIPSSVGTYIPREHAETEGYKSSTNGAVHINYECDEHAVFSLLTKKQLGDTVKNVLALLPRLISDSEVNDVTHLSFERNLTHYNEDQPSMPAEDKFTWNCAGIVNLNKETLTDFWNTYGDNNCICLMTSYSDANSTNIVIDAVYQVMSGGATFNKLQDPETHSYIIKNKGSYKNLNIQSQYGTDITYYFNKYDGLLINMNSIDNYYYRPSKINYSCSYPYLFIGELYRDIPYSTLYGGYDDNALENITWIPISGLYDINASINKTEGDTFFQRWDCVKTLPASMSDVNQVIDITSVMLESHYCLDGRWDKNRVDTDLININNDNYNLYNDVYSQSNNLFSYNILDEKNDLDKFKNLVIWSNQKLPTDDIDTWTNVSQLNSLYLNGEYGGVNKLVNFNDNIIAFQDKAIAGIKFNNDIQISTEQGMPIELANSNKVTGYDYVTKVNGCINKWSINESSSGLYFIDNLNKAIFRLNKDGLTNLSASLGFADWSSDNISLNTWKLDSDAFRTSSDKIKHDVYFINKDTCLCYNEDTQTFTSFYTDYKNIVAIFNLDGKSFYLNKDLQLKEMFTGDYNRNFSIEFNINQDPLEEKIFTNIEYIADTVNDGTLQLTNPFKELYVQNEYQSGKSDLLSHHYPNTGNKFRLWRIDVPRDSVNKFDRIRNPWVRFKLVGNDYINGMTTLHSLVVKYFK